jgi:hypothetical protein
VGNESQPGSTYYYRWTWMGAAFDGTYVYVAASATTADSVIITGLADLHSALFVYRASDGALIGSYAVEKDLFTSAPLLVQGAKGHAQVYITSALGSLYCFGSGKPTGNKPLWVSAKVYPGIPVELLPTATYSYLSATESGAILVAGGQGGMRYVEGEALYAVVNGVFRP